MQRYPLLIVGGGPVGLTVAALLLAGRAAAELEIRLLDSRAAPAWDAERVDLRVYALSRASQRVLHRAGVWESMAASRVSPYRRMRVWQGEDPRGKASLDFDSADIGEPDLGHIVEDGLLRQCLWRRLAGFSNVHLMERTRVRSLERADREVRVVTESGEVVSGRLLIAADGSGSPVRSLAGLPVVERSYRQTALVTHVASGQPHDETAYQRFLPGGPLAFLPLSDGRSSIVWSMPSDDAERLLHAPDETFLDELGRASANVLGRLSEPSARGSFALRILHAPRYCKERIALVGDAAHTVHPLAGQGMNLGLLDAAAIAERIEQALASGEDPGDLKVLRRYERERKSENLKMLVALDALHRFFAMANGMQPIVAAGLAAVDAAPAAKRFLMRRALGLAGALPSIARRDPGAYRSAP